MGAQALRAGVIDTLKATPRAFGFSTTVTASPDKPRKPAADTSVGAKSARK